ncbi:MAG TPA: FAD-dependent oxidoreductase [Verrucomicrobiota bacterium]|nr:FAD-dependent oxidoreductase [Verrucomicrobiota bacterium]
MDLITMQTLQTDFIQEPARSVPVVKQTDVLVVGGGPAGIMAARAAAESGLSVSLVESRGFLGGNLTIGLPVLGFLDQRGRPIIAGLPQQFMDRLRRRGAASEHRPCPLHISLTLVDAEAVKAVALELLLEKGVDIHLHTFFASPILDGERVCGILTESKAGREAIRARVVVDCTGDADVAYRAGVPCEKGDARGGLQPPTLMFAMNGVDTEKLRLSLSRQPKNYVADIIPPEYFGRNRQYIVVGLRRLIAQARDQGLDLPTERVIVITGLRPGEVWVNMTRVKGVDGTDPRSLTHGEIEARRQIETLVKFLVQYVPGFENSQFTRTAPFLGIRETRRIVGRYVLTREDILGCRRFEDAIAVGSYPVDLHRPHDNDCTLEYCGDSYDLPYRALVPQRVSHLLVAGRCISTTHEAMAAIRVMSTCMALGEAAGRAAALAVREGVGPGEIDVAVLRAELRRRGAYLNG